MIYVKIHKCLKKSWILNFWIGIRVLDSSKLIHNPRKNRENSRNFEIQKIHVGSNRKKDNPGPSQIYNEPRVRFDCFENILTRDKLYQLMYFTQTSIRSLLSINNFQILFDRSMWPKINLLQVRLITKLIQSASNRISNCVVIGYDFLDSLDASEIICLFIPAMRLPSHFPSTVHHHKHLTPSKKEVKI